MRQRIYELGRAVGQRKGLDYLAGDLAETKRDLGNIASGLYGGAKWIGKKIVKASYPITGSLSLPVRERIESQLGQEVFDQQSAGSVSTLCESLLVAATIGYLTYSKVSFDQTKIVEKIMGIFVAVAGVAGSGVINGLGRIGKTSSPRASLLGKLVSLPIEAGMGIYDGIKEREDKK
jgi:hypothetical protein